MPFQSILSNPGTNVGLAGKPTRGVSTPRIYSFLNAPTTVEETNHLTDYYTTNDNLNPIKTFPSGVFSNITKDIKVSTINVPNNTTLYWTILHQTTSASDFIATNGSFTSNSYATEIGWFVIEILRDITTEGNEIFQVEIRENSTTGPVVLTSPAITINDSSKTQQCIFDTTNPTTFTEGTQGDTGFGPGIAIRVITTNIDNGTQLYWTLAPGSTAIQGGSTYSSPTNPYDFSWYSYSGGTTVVSGTTFETGNFNDNRILVRANGLGTSGYATFNIYGKSDNITEGNETVQLQIREGTTSGDVSSIYSSGMAGSGGTNGGMGGTSAMGRAGQGGTYGGGGGGNGSYTGDAHGGFGGNGVVRIIWGANRAFPSTNVDITSDTVIGASSDVSAIFTTPGTHSWTAPAGVTSVCVAAVGGGGAGLQGGFSTPLGGGGGGLGWKNNIPVTPGQSYTVVVGAGGLGSEYSSASSGGDSYFINATTVKGGGGKAGVYPTTVGAGGNYVGTGGGNGGNGGAKFANDGGSGGGGAGGYSGNGGAGGSTSGTGLAGTGGAGGGGGAATVVQTDGRRGKGAGGGGVGIYGHQGSTGRILATSPVITLQDTTVNLGPPTPSFEYQVFGGGAGGPTSKPGGGGGGGGLATGSMAWSSNYSNTYWACVIGPGGAPLTSGGDSYLKGYPTGTTGFTFYGRGGGRGATTTTGGYWGGGGGGGCGKNDGSYSWQPYGQNQWDNQYGDTIVTATSTRRQAWSGGYAGASNGAGGGGGAGGSGGDGSYDGIAGGGGAGKVNWFGVTCGVGGAGRGVPQGNFTANGETPGSAGQYQGYGAAGMIIIRYPSSYAPAVSAPGATVTVAGGYRYYSWTSSGSFRVTN